MPAAIDDPRHKDIGLLLTQLRKDKGWLQQDVAERLRKPQTFVSKYETGLRRLDIVELLDILRALETEPHAFIDQVMAMPKASDRR